jgi:hypothetical protein
MACSNVLQTYTVQADGQVGACCGIGMRAIPELNVASVREPDFLRRAIETAENDFLKVWVHYKGPDQILAWAASKDPSILWEGMYAHRCQACARLYRDPAVARVIRNHYQELIADVIQTAWMDEEYVPTEANRDIRGSNAGGAPLKETVLGSQATQVMTIRPSASAESSL